MKWRNDYLSAVNFTFEPEFKLCLNTLRSVDFLGRPSSFWMGPNNPPFSGSVKTAPLAAVFHNQRQGTSPWNHRTSFWKGMLQHRQQWPAQNHPCDSQGLHWTRQQVIWCTWRAYHPGLQKQWTQCLPWCHQQQWGHPQWSSVCCVVCSGHCPLHPDSVEKMAGWCRLDVSR